MLTGLKKTYFHKTLTVVSKICLLDTIYVQFASKCRIFPERGGGGTSGQYHPHPSYTGKQVSLIKPTHILSVSMQKKFKIEYFNSIHPVVTVGVYVCLFICVLIRLML